MIKEALEFITTLQTPQRPITQDLNGQLYAVKADGTLGDAIKRVDARFDRAT
jgi:hypothetical protein